MFVNIADLIHKVEGWILRERQRRYVDKDLNPVLLVPGIGGSILNAVYEDGTTERVWVRLFAADAEFREKLYSKFDPKTGETVSLNEKIRIEVPQDEHGIYSCDILDPDVIIRMNVVYYFHDLIEKMLSWGYEQVFGFGYDFRQSNRLPEIMDAFRKKIEKMYKHAGGKKVKIVSHSMGGLLVKCFLALNHEFFEKHVDTWIAITAPWQGAPGFVTDCLLTGVEFLKGWQKELFVAKWSTHQLLIECPSLYELMSPPDFKWKRPPELHVWRKCETSNGSCSVEKAVFNRPYSCVEVMADALKDNTLHFNGEVLPCPFNYDILEWSNKTRELLKNASLPKGVLFYNIYGTSQDTPFDVCYGSSDCPIENLSHILKTEATFTCVDGDGTVPVESAKADLLDAVARVGIPGDHRGILLEERLFRVVKHWLKAGEPDPFYNPINDYVVIPTPAEYDEYQRSHVEISFAKHRQDEQRGQSHGHRQGEFIAAVISGSNGKIGARAEAHATVEDDGGDFVEVSTFGVVEGGDAGERKLALDKAMAAASDKATNVAIGCRG
ncbi:hypothetical protein SELMODRAFT_113667 [Selaginella moellendorffii]|uniref:Lecithin:cholesterol acyltransferase n=1 Tax=Selaginella moellendorffii TaxID=88036 RepID=D8SCQ9_SELML|nr:hypothetical protein SELMODRAFT_113667 [Selaginella moellendorffii]